MIFVLIFIWKVKRGTLDGTDPSVLHWCNSSMKSLRFHSCTYHVQFFSNRYSSLCICASTVWKWKFNGYCNECWLNRSGGKEMRANLRGEVCLDARVSLGFMRRNDLGETWLFFPSAFPCTQGSRLLQEGRALPRHASLEGFLQATSRLFGCHWDCLKRICFCTVLQGAPHQEKSRSPLSTWHCCYAFVNIKAKRLGQCV